MIVVFKIGDESSIMSNHFAVYRLLALIGVAVISITLFELVHYKVQKVDRKSPDSPASSASTTPRPIDAGSYQSCDKSFLPDSDAMSKSGYNIPVNSYDNLQNFTVLVLVFNRFKAYPEVVQHYICMPFVDRVVVLWANQDVAPPADTRTVVTKCNEKLFIHRLKSTALTERFANFPEIKSDAVFNVDDDKLLPADDLKRGFKVWKKYPWGLVGPIPRGLTGTAPELTYMADLVAGSYSLILTSAAFLHREYLRLFDDKCRGELRSFIDENKNCEDIFLNLLVKENCRCSGVFYIGQGHIRKPKNIPWTTRLSYRSHHHKHRTVCLRKFLNVYGNSLNLTSTSCTYS